MAEKLQNQTFRGVFFTLLSAICFSLAGVIIKQIPWSALSINGFRCTFALIIMLAYMAGRGQRLVINGPVLLGALLNFLTIFLFVKANVMTSAANAIVLQFCCPIFTIFFSAVFLKVRPSKVAVPACAVITAGILCFFCDQLSADGMIGSICALVSGACYAGVFLSKKIPGCCFESATVVSCAFSMLIGYPALMQETILTPTIVILAMVLGVVQFGLAFIFLSIGLDNVSATTVALTSTIEPILNPIIVAVVLGETIGPLSMFGAFLVIGAATVYNVLDAKKS